MACVLVHIEAEGERPTPAALSALGDARRIASSLVKVTSTEDPDRLRVEPGHPERSYLMAKLQGDHMAPGTSRMPPGSLTLTDDQIEQFRNWIAQGASLKAGPNTGVEDPGPADCGKPQPFRSKAC